MPSARAFSRKPRRSFGYLLRETARRLDRAISHGLADFGLTVSQYHLLRELWDEEGLTVRELALRVNIAEPSTLLTLSKMQKNRLIAIRTDTSDRRKRCVFLDRPGDRLRVPVLQTIERVSSLAYSKIDRADLQAAVRVFHAIESSLSAVDGVPSPRGSA
jgi:MarR family transcriptional regulator, organic hydroperoxide resistance regulator